MADTYNNFGVVTPEVGAPSTAYNNFGVVNSTITTAPTVVNNITDSISPSSVGSGQSSGQDTMIGGFMQSSNFVTGVSGWQITADGNVEFGSGKFRGDITGATGTFSGTVNINSLNIPDSTTANSMHVDSTGNTWWGTPVTSVVNATSFSVYPSTGARNNYTGSIGFSFQVNTSITVNRLGRLYVAGNSNNHAINLWISTNTSTPIATGTVLAASASDGNNFKWVSITPVVLTAGNTYVLGVNETNGGDTWKDSWSTSGSMSSVITSLNRASVGSINTYPTPEANPDLMYSTGAMDYSVTTAGLSVAPAKVLNTGAATFSNVTITGGSITTGVLSGLIGQTNIDIADQGWNQTCVFSAASATQVNWASGTLTTAGGTTYNISSGNTGTMAAKTYIYLDTAVSITEFQTTTTASTAVGIGKIIIAVAQNNTTEAIFQVFGGVGGINIVGGNIVPATVTGAEIAATTVTANNIAANTITASQIAANTITASQIAANTITTNQIAANTIVANNIAASTITAAKMNVSQLSAIAADLGSITAGSISINGGVASIDSSGNSTFTSIKVGGSTRQYSIADNGIFSFGDGSDGAATFSNQGTAPTGTTKTDNTNNATVFTLSRDVYYSTMTVNNTVTVITNGYRIFCQTSLTIGQGASGKIQWNGPNGNNGNNGSLTQFSGWTPPVSGVSLSDGYLKGSVITGQGSGTIGGGDRNPVAGGVGTNTTNSLGSNASSGGAGGTGKNGQGGSEGGASGGSGGTVTASNVKLIANWHLSTLLDIILSDGTPTGYKTGQTIRFDNSASAGGGGCGGYGVNNNGGQAITGGGGGSGGASGGIVAIYAKIITINSGGSITSNGGNGGNGGVGFTAIGGDNFGGGAGGGGGGAGGNGGTIIMVYNTLTNSGSVTASLGTGGTGGAGGSGGSSGQNGTSGTAGSNGSAGAIYQFQLSL